MLFNSYSYFLFLPLVLCIYYLLSSVKSRNLFLLLCSYFFYMCWQPIFILLIMVSTVTDYLVGVKISQADSQKEKRLLLLLSLILNLGILFYFKYFNFLAENIEAFLGLFGLNANVYNHSLLLPVGISFYTFQTLGYSFDVYRDSKSVEKNFIDFSLYVSFFPQLVAGPIERSKSLLPQFKIKQVFSLKKFRYGALLILIGLFKKLVFADRFAIYADEIFLSPESYNGLSSFLGMLFFSFQIYNDFSGYTDIAIGSACLLGFTLMDNFKGPYFSSSIKEFWQRWHISLSTWFRDYLYIPLGGSRNGQFATYRNLIIVFLITAIWHGANWTFIVWGIIHGLLLILERLGVSKIISSLPRFLGVIYVFTFTSLAWIFFRATSITDGFILIQSLFIYESGNLLNHDIFTDVIDSTEMYISLVLLLGASMFHFLEYKGNVALKISNSGWLKRWLFYILIFLLIIYFGEYGYYKEFIYFQF